jgi:pilus assembly protein CpaC
VKTTMRFIHRYSWLVLLFICAASMLRAQGPARTPVNLPLQTSRQDAANDLSVVVGKSVVLDCAQPVERVAVGLGGIAEATAISPI